MSDHASIIVGKMGEALEPNVMTKGMKDRNYIVSGAARGIGLAIANRLLKLGAVVHACDIDDMLASQFEAGGLEGNLHLHSVDISSEQSVADFIRDLSSSNSSIDGLVNNAAILDATAFESLESQRFNDVLRINLEGTLTTTRLCAPLLARSSQPAIVNIASIMGLFGSRDSIPYSTSKGAIVNLTRCLAVDLAPKGIRVNSVAPGFIETRMSKLPDGSSEYATDEFQDVYFRHRRLPIGRVGQPDEIAGPVCFLLSDDASYITGQILLVDGGVSSIF